MQPSVDEDLNRAGQGPVFSPAAPVAKHSLSTACVRPWATCMKDTSLSGTPTPGLRGFTPSWEERLDSRILPWLSRRSET